MEEIIKKLNELGDGVHLNANQVVFIKKELEKAYEQGENDMIGKVNNYHKLVIKANKED